MSDDTTVTTCCPYCRGAGRVKLAPVYSSTLALLRRHGREATGAELARIEGGGVKATAVNNRLAALERAGLVVSRRRGRERLYRVTGGKGD